MVAISNRYEIVFLYDVRDANPNGDPDTSNMPRMDEVTGENIVTDVRLKRTIRDHWLSQEKNVLVRAETDEKGNRKSMDALATDYLDLGKIDKKKAAEARKKLINEMPGDFIDVRTFGAAITLKEANVSITGPVQFGLGRSLNLPNINSRSITTTLASGEEKGMGTIGMYHTVDYSLIRFHGLVNEYSAKKVEFSEIDLNELLKAMWIGTKQLNTRSKFNHMPRFLLVVKSKEGMPQVGDLDLCISLIERKGLTSIKDVKLDVSRLIERLAALGDRIEGKKVQIDSNLIFLKDGNEITPEEFIREIDAEELDLK
ncbi:MAG: type I-B CRISPR-associated protein Cas7/Csh2 [Candidatus Helarchaeota archaeon]